MLAVLLFITLLGIPVGIAVMALYPALLMTGYVVGVLFIARLAQTALGKGAPDSFAVTIGYFALALLLVFLVSMIPFIGALASAVVMLLGLGGVALELHRRRQARSPPSKATGVDRA